MYTSE